MSTSQKNSRTLLPFQKRAPTSSPFPRENSPFSWMKVKFLKLAALEGVGSRRSGSAAHHHTAQEDRIPQKRHSWGHPPLNILQPRGGWGHPGKDRIARLNRHPWGSKDREHLANFVILFCFVIRSCCPAQANLDFMIFLPLLTLQVYATMPSFY